MHPRTVIDIVVGRLKFYRDSPLIFFLRQQLTERNSTETSHRLESECDLKMHVRNPGYPLPLQIWGPKTQFFEDFAT